MKKTYINPELTIEFVESDNDLLTLSKDGTESNVGGTPPGPTVGGTDGQGGQGEEEEEVGAKGSGGFVFDLFE